MASAIRGADAVAYPSAASFVVAFPAGSLAGDTALIQVCAAYDITPPVGWTQLFLRNGTIWNAYIGWKILTAGDISAGTVTINTGGAFNGSSSIVVFSGTATFRETITAYTASVNFVTSGAVLATDLGIGFGSQRQLGAMPTFTPGTLLDSAINASFDVAVYSVPMAAGVNTVVTNMGGSANWEGALVVVVPPSGGGGGGTLKHLQCAVCGFRLDTANLNIANFIAAKHTKGWGPAHVVTVS